MIEEWTNAFAVVLRDGTIKTVAFGQYAIFSTAIAATLDLRDGETIKRISFFAAILKSDFD
jgi:hypothetical protein